MSRYKLTHGIYRTDLGHTQYPLKVKICEYCGNQYYSRSGLRLHRRLYHENEVKRY